MEGGRRQTAAEASAALVSNVGQTNSSRGRGSQAGAWQLVSLGFECNYVQHAADR